MPLLKLRAATKNYHLAQQKKIKTELKEMKEELTKVKTIILQTAVPNSIQQHHRGVIRCCICQTVPIRPPIIVSRCCMSVIGCEQCVQQFIEFRGNPTCPLCRDTSFLTMRLLGFDAFSCSAQLHAGAG